VRFAGQVPASARALDLACGSGRHTRWLAARGLAVTAVDRDAVALAGLRDVATVLEADLEGAPWPLPGRPFDLVVVTNYLWRALLPQVVASVAPGGLLVYETFALGNERHGRPRNPDFLLRPGELLDAVRVELEVVAYEHGDCVDPPRCVQRIAAQRPIAPGQAGATPPARIVG
jgi:SAM-dependent methyltransferase